MSDVSEVKKFVSSVVSVVNAEQALVKIDYKKLVDQVLNADEAGLQEIAESLKGVDLNDDVLEAMIETAIQSGVAPAAFVLRLVKLVFPKKPNP